MVFAACFLNAAHVLSNWWERFLNLLVFCLFACVAVQWPFRATIDLSKTSEIWALCVCKSRGVQKLKICKKKNILCWVLRSQVKLVIALGCIKTLFKAALMNIFIFTIDQTTVIWKVSLWMINPQTINEWFAVSFFLCFFFF